MLIQRASNVDRVELSSTQAASSCGAPKRDDRANTISMPMSFVGILIHDSAGRRRPALYDNPIIGRTPAMSQLLTAKSPFASGDVIVFGGGYLPASACTIAQGESDVETNTEPPPRTSKNQQQTAVVVTAAEESVSTAATKRSASELDQSSSFCSCQAKHTHSLSTQRPETDRAIHRSVPHTRNRRPMVIRDFEA